VQAEKDKKRLGKEILKLEKAIQIEMSSKTLMQLAEAYKKAERLSDAVDLLKKGTELYPDNSTIKISYARYGLMTEVVPENLNEMQMHLQQIVLDKPDNLAAQRLLHQINEMRDKSENPPEVITSPPEVITSPSEEPEQEAEIDVIQIAHQMIQNGDPEKALAIFQTILEQNPDDEEAQTGFTIAYTALVQMQNIPDQEAPTGSPVNLQVKQHMYVVNILESWRVAAQRIKQSRLNLKQPED
jgi:tetratricopeptide (TPR) repeat protein